tara:strand:- start:3790 stop:6159 length:2370 start_codon:yes stop_codon:yes gene_type:complete
MSLNLPNPSIKSIIITPVDSKTTESGMVMIDYKTKINVIIKDTSPAGTTKYEWMNIPNFTKYMKLVACQVYYKSGFSSAETVTLAETATPLSRNTIVTPDSDNVEGWQPSVYASLGPSYKYSEKIRRVLQTQIFQFAGIANAVSTPVENESYKSDEYSRFYVHDYRPGGNDPAAQVEFQEISLEAARSPRSTNPTFAANDATTYDISFTFDFDLKDIPVDSGFNDSNGPLENLTHLIFLDFDFYQALEDAGVKQLVGSETYRRSQEIEFSKNLSSRSKVIKSIVRGLKTPTLTYKTLADGTPWNGPAVQRTELVRQPDGTFVRTPINDLLYEADDPSARRILVRTIQNNKVHYLNPFSITSYPSYDQMKEQAAAATGILTSHSLNASEYKKSLASASRAPFFSEIPSYTQDGVTILNMTVEEERQISQEESYCPFKLTSVNPDDPGSVVLEVDFDKLFLQKSAYYQIYKNMSDTERANMISELTDDNGEHYFNIRLYEQQVEYSVPRHDYKSNITIKKPEQRKYLVRTEVDSIESLKQRHKFSSGDAYDKASFTSCVYGCEIEFVDPVAEKAIENIDNIKRAIDKMEDFYNHAIVPSFGLTNEAKTSLYGLGNKVVFSESTEFVGSIDHQTGLYTEDFAATVENGREYSPVTVREFHTHLNEGGVIFVGMQSYRAMKNLVYPREGRYEQLDELREMLRVTPSGSPKLLEVVINDMRKFLTVLSNVFGSYSMDLSDPQLKKMVKPIVKYSKEFSNHPVVRSDKEIMYYDNENILKSEPIETEEHMREWWE